MICFILVMIINSDDLQCEKKFDFMRIKKYKIDLQKNFIAIE